MTTQRGSEIIIRGEVQRRFAITMIEKLSADKLWSVVIRPYTKRRTLDQNALVHGHFAIIARETGNDPGDVKEALKTMFLPPRYVEIDGKTIEVRRETSKLNTKELAEFANRVMAWAAQDLGIILPTRDDQKDAA